MNTDGLSAEELRASRECWWDEAFTRLLLEVVPAGAATLIDVGCGLGTLAHAILPARPKLAYLGVDLDEERLQKAAAAVKGTPFAARVTLRRAAAERLPVYDGTAEVIAFVLTLQHLADVPRALTEAHRSLVPGGRLLAVEPDNLGARFYFDGPLDALTAAFSSLCRRARAQRLPADLALGPRLPSLLEASGFRVEAMRVHAVQSTERVPAAELAARLAAMGRVVLRSAGLDESAQEWRAFSDALDALAGERRAGWSSHVVPAFLSVALRPS